jgi:hypothetical protein
MSYIIYKCSVFNGEQTDSFSFTIIIKSLLFIRLCMTVYSHSRLSCYEQCPARFKLQYIDKVETEVEQSVEAFLGVRVHEALEKLYRDLGFQKKDSLEDP